MSQATWADPTAETPVDEIHTITGLLAGTPVLTAQGAVAVELLGPGDRVITRNGMRCVVAVDWTVRAQARVVRIAPRSLGAGRPGAVLVVAPAQPLLIRDWRAQALWGKPEVAVPAARLVDGHQIRAGALAVGRFLTLRFAAPEVIYAEGVEVSCPGETLTA